MGTQQPGAAQGLELRRLGETLDRVAKRGCDIVLAVTLLVLLAPVIVVTALAIKLESRGPVFYRARRVGYRGAPLAMLKFRKMGDGAGGSPLTVARDSRFTKMGRILADLRLDELPQLWHVLRGEMSLVGPRPEDPAFVELHREAYDEILRIRPGIAGLSQLAFAHEATILHPTARVGFYVERLLPQKVQIDLFYTKRRSLVFDFWILAATALVVMVRQDVAVHRRTGRLSLRRRPVPALQAVPERVKSA